MLSQIITDSYFNSIINSDIYLVHNNQMKYIEYSARFKQCLNETDAPKKQKELAAWLDYSQPMINYWINGEKLPSMDAAIKIAGKFGVCAEWLITGNGPKHFNEQVQQINHNGYLESANLTPEQLQVVKLMIAQFEQTNPVKDENKSLTYPTENVGGGAESLSAEVQEEINIRLGYIERGADRRANSFNEVITACKKLPERS